jgi:hypothetical protein
VITEADHEDIVTARNIIEMVMKATRVVETKIDSGGFLQIKRISVDDHDVVKEDEYTYNKLGYIPFLSYQLQALNSPFKVSWLPLLITLRLCTSRRYRKELAQGRPGILLKPKLNALQGDTSLRIGHRPWHKKDSSAIHVIPRVKMTLVFLIKVANPTLGTVRLRFTASNCQGEPKWNDNNNDDTQTTTDLPDLLVDTIHQRFVDATFKPRVLQHLCTTETVELLLAEDSIIELGVKAWDTPEQIV